MQGLFEKTEFDLEDNSEFLCSIRVKLPRTSTISYAPFILQDGLAQAERLFSRQQGFYSLKCHILRGTYHGAMQKNWCRKTNCMFYNAPFRSQLPYKGMRCASCLHKVSEMRKALLLREAWRTLEAPGQLIRGRHRRPCGVLLTILS